MDRCREQLRQPAEVQVNAASGRLVRQVRRDHEWEPEIATGEDEREVPREIAGVDDHDERIRMHVEQETPERRQPVALVIEGQRSGQVHQQCPPAADLDLAARDADRGTGDVGGLRVSATGTREERRLPDL